VAAWVVIVNSVNWDGWLFVGAGGAGSNKQPVLLRSYKIVEYFQLKTKNGNPDGEVKSLCSDLIAFIIV
jgi:hypothetical protein